MRWEGLNDASLDRRLNAAFFVFGLINNAAYVVFLSAAQALVAGAVPTGVVLFAAIAPALLAKLCWPFLVRGRARYGKRVVGCTASAAGAIFVCAVSPALWLRLTAIGVASFASGLGELTYLQLSTLYAGPADRRGRAIGWFSSGTGAAGPFGAGLWWILRGLGVELGLGLTCVIPLGMSIAYFLILPPPAAFSDLAAPSTSAYTALPDDADGQVPDAADVDTKSQTRKLGLADKIAIARPMVLPYMLPLFVVYCAEYSINQGVSPTLIFPVPSRASYPVLGTIITQLGDYYPLWQLVYQSFVFISRSSYAVFAIPPLPKRWIPAPAIAQTGLLILVALESRHGFFEAALGTSVIWVVAFFIALEGLSGGYAYVSTFCRIPEDEAPGTDPQVSEFRRA